MRMQNRTARRTVGLVALAALAPLVGLAAPAAAQELGSAPTEYATFDVRPRGAVVDFTALAPDAVPLEVQGGVLAAGGDARKGPQAFGIAGIAPVPAAGSVPLIIPQTVPVVGVPIPAEIRDALGNIDYTKLPQFCQASYPVREGNEAEVHCGGPAQQNPQLGFTSDTTDGRVSVFGDPEDDHSARLEASAHGASATFPGLQAEIRNYSASVSAGINVNGRPQAVADAKAAGVTLLGGALRLSGLSSETKLVYDGTPKGIASSSTFRLGHASLLGYPISIGADGIHLAGTTLVDGKTAESLIRQVEENLKIQGLSIRLLPAVPLEVNGSLAKVASGGVQVSYAADEPVQLRYTAVFGQSQASVTAVPNRDFAAPVTAVDGLADIGGLDQAGDGALAAESPALPGLDGPVDEGVTPPAVADDAVAAGATQQSGDAGLFGPLRTAASSLPPARIEAFYLAFAALVGFTTLLARSSGLTSLVRRPAAL